MYKTYTSLLFLTFKEERKKYMADYQPNSNRSKTEQEQTTERKVEKIITGPVVTRKKKKTGLYQG